jgi:hypothetical protein
MLFGILALLFAVTVGGSATATDCDPASAFKIQHLDVISLPAPANTSLTMTYDVSTKEPILDGSVDYRCTLNGMPVYSEILPLCTQTTCPIEDGRHVQSSSSVSPSVAGTLLCTLKWISEKSEPLLCVKMKYTPSLRSFRGTMRQYIPSFEVTSSYALFEPELYEPVASNSSLIH